MPIDSQLPAVLSELRPEAVALLAVANECARQSVDPDLLELLQVRIGTLIGSGSLSQRILTENSGAADLTTSHNVAAAFAEQFIIDVSGITDADRESLASQFPGEAIREFVTSLYILECTYRLSLIAQMLLGDDEDPSIAIDFAANSVASTELPSIRDSLKDYQDAVVRGTDLDPVTTELVRLRCARTHNCRICQTLRLSDARAAGADDTMTAKVDFYELSDLDEPHKIALRITDALITRPDTLSLETVITARANYSPVQLAELCLDITKWSTQKIHVALGTDGADALPKNEQGMSFFGFDDLGHVTGYSAIPTGKDSL
jgi:alkylhydroperoxidase family enzyme